MALHLKLYDLYTVLACLFNARQHQDKERFNVLY
jgi:hypothetical protein